MFNKTIYMLFLVLSLIFIFPLLCHAADNPDFTPDWQVGDSWNIVMRGMGIAELGDLEGDIKVPDKPLYIHFSIMDLKDVDGELCFIVEITYQKPIIKEALHLYVRKDDFTLKKVMKIGKNPDGSTYIDHFSTQNNDHDFIIFLDSFCISIPCDFPNFPVTNTNEERTIQVSDSVRLMTQKVTFMDENTVEIELSTENNGGLLKSLQIWERGKPWWSSIKRTFTYKDYKTGEMKTEMQYDPVLINTDLIPPEISLAVNPDTLWPPNHEMVEIIPTITVSDNYDRFPEVKVLSVESSEPDDASGEGDGHTTQDIQINKEWDGNQHKEVEKIILRAEREGKGDGRIYTITYIATDFSGNTSTASARVTVPHDMGDGKEK